MDNEDNMNTLEFRVKKITGGAFDGYYQIISCTAVVPPSVRMIEFENHAYSMDHIKKRGQEIIETDSRMEGYKVKITVV